MSFTSKLRLVVGMLLSWLILCCSNKQEVLWFIKIEVR